MNMKQGFAKWFSPKAPSSYKRWFNTNLNSKLDDINYAYQKSFDKSLFDIDVDDIKNEIMAIKNNISNRETVRDKTFSEYDKRMSNGIPKAIINQYYIRYLSDYGDNAIIDSIEPEIDVSANSNEKKETAQFSYEKDLQNSLISQVEELFEGYKIFGEYSEGIHLRIQDKVTDLVLEHKTENKILVVELKAGLANFGVLGQIYMYMGPLSLQYPDKEISGVIIAGEIDESLKMACSAINDVKLKTYKMELALEDAL
jgi:hypothetical protein